MSITKSEQNFAKALMLAIYAPNDEANERCVAMAEEFGKDLTVRETELVTMGIEVALEYLRERDKSRREALANAGL
tara:strand:- start:808 stop:1035 length:228 start_codon:yes stop_codon:yes gene_type:complete